MRSSRQTLGTGQRSVGPAGPATTPRQKPRETRLADEDRKESLAEKPPTDEHAGSRQPIPGLYLG